MKNEEIVIEDGSVHWFYGEQVPEGFYWVLLDVVEKRSSIRTEIASFVSQWKGAILVEGSDVYKRSPKGAPAVGSCFAMRSDPYHFGLALMCFYNLEDAEKFVASNELNSEHHANYDWRFLTEDYYKDREVSYVKEEPKKIQGIEYDRIWFDEQCNYFSIPVTQTKEQTEQQRIAQRQVDFNKAKITKLEKELKDLRQLQKLLKGLR